MILNQIMSGPKKTMNHSIKKLKTNSQYQLSEPETDQNNFVVQAGW